MPIPLSRLEFEILKSLRIGAVSVQRPLQKYLAGNILKQIYGGIDTLTVAIRFQKYYNKK